MDYEQSVITQVHDVLPDIPISLIKEMMQFFPDTGVSACAEMVIHNILENDQYVLEYRQANSATDNENSLHKNMESEIEEAITHIRTDAQDIHNSQAFRTINLNEFESSSSNSTTRSNSPDLEILEEETRSPESARNAWVLRPADGAFTVGIASDQSNIQIATTSKPLNTVVISTPETNIQIASTSDLLNTTAPCVIKFGDTKTTMQQRLGSHQEIQPNNLTEAAKDVQRVYTTSSLVVDQVLSILPNTPVDIINDLVKTNYNDNPAACAEVVLQQLLEMNDNQHLDQSDFISLNEPWDVGNAYTDAKPNVQNEINQFLTEDNKPKPSKKRKRSVEERDKSIVDVLEIPTKSPVLDVPAEIEEQFECNCCYNEVGFEELVQCAEGHLFCAECLRRYTEESVYGQGRRTLSCMHDGCDEMFPSSQLMRALPEQLRLQYEERIAEEVLNLANLENLSRCPFCNFQALLEDDQHIFACPNPTCEKRSCRKCGTIWEEHEGLLCNQVEKEAETKIRTEYEERMAEARIRTCTKCKARFTKESGCNKITCRCGEQLCYICRASIKDYSHFCQHVRNPGKPCNKCKMCFLWTDADYDDELAISEIKQMATTTRSEQGFEEEKEIGAPGDPPPNAKKKKYQAHRYRLPHVPHVPQVPNVNLRNLWEVIDNVAAGNLPRPAHEAANLPGPAHEAANLFNVQRPVPVNFPQAVPPPGQLGLVGNAVPGNLPVNFPPPAHFRYRIPEARDRPKGQYAIRRNYPQEVQVPQRAVTDRTRLFTVRAPRFTRAEGQQPEIQAAARPVDPRAQVVGHEIRVATQPFHFPDGVPRVVLNNVQDSSVQVGKSKTAEMAAGNSAAAPASTSNNLLDNCQSLLQEHVRNMAGFEQGQAMETHRQLKSIAQQANRLAQQLKQQEARKKKATLKGKATVAPPAAQCAYRSFNPEPNRIAQDPQVFLHRPAFINVETKNISVIKNNVGKQEVKEKYIFSNTINDFVPLEANNRSPPLVTSRQTLDPAFPSTSGTVSHFGSSSSGNHQLNRQQELNINNIAGPSSGNIIFGHPRVLGPRKPEAALGAPPSEDNLKKTQIKKKI